jgi:hypothetical protein
MMLASQIEEFPHLTLGLLVDRAVLHYESNAAQSGYVARRIAFDGDKVSEQSSFDPARYDLPCAGRGHRWKSPIAKPR